MELFQRAADIGKLHIREWLPLGHIERENEWVCPSPSHPDEQHVGNFSVNLDTGSFNDYADPDFRGRDAVTLYALLNDMRNGAAAKEILAKYDPNYFPGTDDYVEPKYEWYQLTKGHKNAPELPKNYHGEKHWPLEVKAGDQWRVAMWITRYRFDDGKKLDCPYTLWTDGKSLEWRKGALNGCKYPLYGLRQLSEHPNARVALYEGQKTAACVQPVLGDDWCCVAWYGGAGNSALTDFEPLTGRDVWYSFDADGPGRKAIKSILEQVHAQVHLVYPPADVEKGWDHADAVDAGYTKEQLEALLLASPTTEIVEQIASPDTRPTTLSSPVSQDLKEKINTALFKVGSDKKGNPSITIDPDWTYMLPQYDTVIGNSIKYDYTTGVETTMYDNSSLYIAALEQRLIKLGITANYATVNSIDKIRRAVINNNSHYNRVADYIDNISMRFPDQSETVLDKFMDIFEFNIPRNENEDEEDYEARCIKVRSLYRELFDIFFTRMHGHINGTRKVNGEYKGLIENDIVPVFSGPQGCGKTTLCRWLACDDELYADIGSGGKAAFGSSDTVKKIRGKLFVELGEMNAIKGADINTTKSFISQAAVEVDIKYVEGQPKIPMTASFAGTDNDGQFLVDTTGNRRWWPIKITKILFDKMDEDPDLKYKLHAYYAQKTKNMTTKQIKEYCIPSKELETFIEGERNEALVTYSDYEACVAVINGWKTPDHLGCTLNQAEIEKIAYNNGYMTRISRKSCLRAMAECGLVQKRKIVAGTDKYSMSWVYEDRIPF